MKIITWNVAGFRKSQSLETWDYSDMDLHYFANEILQFSPDIIHFQEVEFTKNFDSVAKIAKLLKIENYEGIPMHPNHIGEGELGYAILSKNKIENLEILEQPYPNFPLVFDDGKPAVRHDKKTVSYITSEFKCSTLQLQPIHYWGYNYYEEPGLSYGTQIAKSLESLDSDIITGDFQISHLEIPLKTLMTKYKDSLPDGFTRLRQNGKHTKSDHVLVKKDYKVVNSKIIKTKTDHFLCYSEIEKKES